MILWTPMHVKTLLPAMAAMVLIGLVLRRILAEKDLNVRLIPLKIIALLLVSLEVGKQIDTLVSGSELDRLSFYLSSLFVIAIPLMAFYQGKYRQKVFALVASLCASVFVLMLVYPNLIYSDNDVREFWTDYFSFHSVVCNGLVALAFVLIVSLRLYEPDPSGEHGLVLLFALGFCGLSATMAHFLRVNLHGHHFGNTAMLEDMRRSAQSVFGMGMSQLLLALAVAMLHNLLPNLMDRFHHKNRMALKGR